MDIWPFVFLSHFGGLGSRSYINLSRKRTVMEHRFSPDWIILFTNMVLFVLFKCVVVHWLSDIFE
jgi:hypothetical protein